MATTVTVSRDVLTDVLGSAVAIGEDGIINADLRVIGDFGDDLITPTWDTVTGFTGHTETAGLVEFASRVFDPTDKVWVQEDAFAGSVTRASSMNRYAYVEGSPVSHVDVLGAYRAAAAMAQQQLSAADYAAFVAGVKAWYASPACVGYYGCQPVFAAAQAMQAAQAANFASAMNQTTSYHQELARNKAFADNSTAYARSMNIKYVRDAVDANVAAYEVANGTGYWGGLVDSLSIAGWGTVNFFSGFANGASGVVNFAADLVVNAQIPGCQLAAFGVDPGHCIDVPDIPMIPIAGDPALYTWSQRTGTFTFAAMATVATGGIGAGGFSASASVAVANATGLTAIRSGALWVRAAAPQISTHARTFFTNTDQAVRTWGDDLGQRFSNINWADDTGSINLAGFGDDAGIANGSVTRVFRVESPQNARLNIDADGNVDIIGDNALFLNFGDEARAQEFLVQRVTQGFEGSVIRSFDVPTSFVEQLAARATPESMARTSSVFQVDVTRTSGSYGLRSSEFDGLLCAIIPGSAC